MCKNCTTNGSHENHSHGVISRISHINSAIDQINQPFLGFHRAGGSGMFTITYAFEVRDKVTDKAMQYLRFDVTALFNNTFDLLIADAENNVLHEANFKNALEVGEFIKSMVDVDKIAYLGNDVEVVSVNVATLHGYDETKDGLIALLKEQDKTSLTAYLGMGGIVIERKEEKKAVLN